MRPKISSVKCETFCPEGDGLMIHPCSALCMLLSFIIITLKIFSLAINTYVDNFRSVREYLLGIFCQEYV